MSKIDAYVFASVFPSKKLPSKKGQGAYPAQVRAFSRHGATFAASPLVFSVALSVTSVTVARRATRLGRLGLDNSWRWLLCKTHEKHSTTGGPSHHSLTLWSSNILQWYGLILVFVGHQKLTWRVCEWLVHRMLIRNYSLKLRYKSLAFKKNGLLGGIMASSCKNM